MKGPEEELLALVEPLNGLTPEDAARALPELDALLAGIVPRVDPEARFPEVHALARELLRYVLTLRASGTYLT